MHRVRDWQSRLAACLAERWARPFAWGVQDCCLFAADCIEACCGVDPASDVRGTYADALGAQRALAALGSLEAVAAARCGPECPVALAQPGDVGLVLMREADDPGEGRLALAVCGGAHWYGPGAQGVRLLTPGLVRRSWRVC